jgi:DNA invertase Pin-like site-specific DNA recombinase
MCAAWLRTQPWPWRVDCGKESRPALHRLPADARRRRFDTALVYSYDRFARSRRQLVNGLAEFDALGIHFVSPPEEVDTSTTNRRPVFGTFASIAEFELALIRERVRSGLAAAKARGTRIGEWPNSDVDVARIAQTAHGQHLLMRDSADSRRQCENSAALCRKTRSRPPQVLHAQRCFEACRARGESMRFCHSLVKQIPGSLVLR